MIQQQSSSGPAIAAEALVKRYPGDVVALDGVSFSVEPGNRLRPARAERRRQVDDGADPDDARPTRRRAGDRRRDRRGLRDPVRVRRTIGSVGQRVAVDPEATGRENLILEARIHGLGGAPDAQPGRRAARSASA